MSKRLLYCWQEPTDTVTLCKHVLQHGAQQWQLLAEQMPDCTAAAALCAVRWHRLQQLHEPNGINWKRLYSDWELCLLHLAHQTGAELGISKAQVCKEVASWLPDRTPAAIKQAYTANSAGKADQLLLERNWPSNLPGFLQAWQGSEISSQDHTAAQDKLLAAQILARVQPDAAALPGHMPAAAYSLMMPAEQVPAAVPTAISGSTPAAAAAVAAGDLIVGDISAAAGLFAAGDSMQLEARTAQQRFAGYSAVWAGAWPGVGIACSAAPATGDVQPQHIPFVRQLQSSAEVSADSSAAAVEQQQVGPADVGVDNIWRQLTPELSTSTAQLARAEPQANGLNHAPAVAMPLPPPGIGAVGSPGWMQARAAAAAAGPPIGGSVILGCDFDLPENDAAARQALEQHFDDMLAAGAVELPAGGQDDGTAAARAGTGAMLDGWSTHDSLGLSALLTDHSALFAGTGSELPRASSAAAPGPVAAAAHTAAGTWLLSDTSQGMGVSLRAAAGSAGADAELQRDQTQLNRLLSLAGVGSKRHWLHTVGSLQYASSLPGMPAGAVEVDEGRCLPATARGVQPTGQQLQRMVDASARQACVGYGRVSPDIAVGTASSAAQSRDTSVGTLPSLALQSNSTPTNLQLLQQHSSTPPGSMQVASIPAVPLGGAAGAGPPARVEHRLPGGGLPHMVPIGVVEDLQKRVHDLTGQQAALVSEVVSLKRLMQQLCQAVWAGPGGQQMSGGPVHG